MAGNILDWSNARLPELQTAPHLGRLDELAKRLESEVGGGKLPFIDLGFLPPLLTELACLRKEFLPAFDHLVLLGIGGSALGMRALQKAFAPGQDLPGHTGPWLWIADNVDAFSLGAWFDRLPAEKTLVVVVSKSGGTIETAAQYFLAREWLKRSLGERWKDHVFMVTGQKGFLRDLVSVQHLRSLPVPEELGGRYSVVSAVGLLPAAFMGLDIEAFVDGVKSVVGSFAKPGFGPEHLAGHPAWNLAVWNRALWDKGYDQLLFYTYLPQWASFGDWFAQLWAESLGKEGKGSQPIPAVGVTDQHSVTQMFLDGPRNKACLFLTCPAQPMGEPFPDDLPPSFDYLRGKHFGDLLQAEALGTEMALTKHHVPLVEIRLGAETIRQAGKLVGLTGLATILTGWLLDINPLDQPAVELGKRLALARLGAPGLEEEKSDLAAFVRTSQAGGHAQEF